MMSVSSRRAGMVLAVLIVVQCVFYYGMVVAPGLRFWAIVLFMLAPALAFQVGIRRGIAIWGNPQERRTYEVLGNYKG